MRNHREVRYLITPANMLWSLGSVPCWPTTARQRAGAPADRRGRRAGAAWAQRGKPTVVVLVVGETARAANWGLNGYARQTTPSWRGCRSSTSPTSRVAAPTPRSRCRACSRRSGGATTTRRASAAANRCCTCWRAPASRCTGATTSRAARACATACRTDSVAGARRARPVRRRPLLRRRRCCTGSTSAWRARAAARSVLVLHMLGNHGPSYFRRYPPAFARFQPACDDDDLQPAAATQIVNAYDNALLYTDHRAGAARSRACRRTPTASTRRCSTSRTTASRWARTACTCTACRTRSRPTSRRACRWCCGVGRLRRRPAAATATACSPARAAPAQPRPSVPHAARPARRARPALRTGMGPDAAVPRTYARRQHPMRRDAGDATQRSRARGGRAGAARCLGMERARPRRLARCTAARAASPGGDAWPARALLHDGGRIASALLLLALAIDALRRQARRAAAARALDRLS